MSTLTAPIYTGALNGQPLRFFRAPFVDPHMPWHVPNDLHICLGMPEDLQRHYQRMHQSAEWARDVRTVATCDGIVTIAPPWMAQGLITSVIQFGRVNAAIEVAFHEEAGRALELLVSDMPPDAFFDFITQASLNALGLQVAGGVT